MRAAKLQLNDPPSAHVLGVDRSVRGCAWVSRLQQALEPIASALAQTYGVPEIVGRILVARGARAETAGDWFTPSLKRLLPDPSTLRDMQKAAARFAAAIVGHETIAVFGDYDVDGAASVALVERFLRMHGRGCICRIPDRLTEGYGPNPDAMRELREAGAALILTVDCGTTSHEAIEAAHAAGADVIVLDHHQAGETLPPAHAIVNPNRLDDISGQGHLAAAGIVFLFLVETVRQLRLAGHYEAGTPAPDLLGLLDLVALATVCDVVPLTGVNRAFVAKGLLAMRLRANPGIAALADAGRLKGPPDARSLGFVLGPRINAGGRIGDCGLGARLLATNDPVEAGSIAATLERLNAERRALESVMFDDALAQADSLLSTGVSPAILVVRGHDWHPGVLGLIGSRLVERFGVPAMALAIGAREAVGSIRSIAGRDVGKAIREAVDAGLARKGGGHAMAGGVTVATADVPALTAFLDKKLAAPAAVSDELRCLEIDGVLSPRGATLQLLDLLDRIGPFGQGCPEPRFVLGCCHAENVAIVGGAHVRCRLRGSDGGTVDGIAFRAADAAHGQLLLNAHGAPLNVAGYLTRDGWNGRTQVKFVIDDVAEPRASF